MRLPSLLLLAALASACAERRPAERALAVASDAEAAALVARFLAAFVDGHVETAASFLCEQDDAAQARAKEFFRASQAEGSPFRATTYDVVSAQAKWQGTVPFFYVEVAFPRTRAEGTIRHGYHVRADTGCIEGLLGPAMEPPPAAAPRPAGDSAMDAVDL